MSTSGTQTWTVTAQQVVTYSVKLLGKLGEGDSLTSTEYNDCLWFLNALTKSMIAKNDYSPGLKMWQRRYGFAFLSNTTGVYQLGSKGGTGLSYWTEQFLQTTSGGSNAANATTINVSSAGAATYNMQPNIGSQTGAFTAGQYIGIQLDNGSLFWTTIVSVNTVANTITITTGIPSSSNNIGNVIYGFTTIAAPPQVIEVGILRDINQNDVPLRSMTMEEYMMNPSKQSPTYTGDPIGYYYQPHLTGNSGQGYGLLSTDVGAAQDVSKYLVLEFYKEIDDFTNPTDEPEFPKEWFMALTYGLAQAIAPMFNAEFTPQMGETFGMYLKMAKNSNNKRSTAGFLPGVKGQTLEVQWR